MHIYKSCRIKKGNTYKPAFKLNTVLFLRLSCNPRIHTFKSGIFFQHVKLSPFNREVDTKSQTAPKNEKVKLVLQKSERSRNKMVLSRTVLRVSSVVVASAFPVPLSLAAILDMSRKTSASVFPTSAEQDQPPARVVASPVR